MKDRQHMIEAVRRLSKKNRDELKEIIALIEAEETQAQNTNEK